MERVRREAERVKEGRNRQYREEKREIWCCFCTRFTGPKGLCNALARAVRLDADICTIRTEDV